MQLATRNSIFPVMLFDFDPDKQVSLENMRDFTYLGTGFFLYLETCIAFVTCRHVVDITCGPNQRIGIGRLEKNGKYWWDYMEFHSYSDLAFARFDSSTWMDFIHPLIPWRQEELLLAGTQVNSFGFPFTTKHVAPGDTRRNMMVHEVFFSGYISILYDQRYFKGQFQYPFDHTYGLSFECPKGLSGAPLLMNADGSAYVVGVMYGNQSIRYTVDTYEQVDENGKTTQHEIVQQNHFGLACSHQVFSDIPPLL